MSARSAADELRAGRAALRRGSVAEARRHLEASVAASLTPEALEELGLAVWWLDDAAATFDAREHAYRLYRDRKDDVSAARVATWLVWDNLAFRGDFAVASGWLERARRLIAGHERSSEYGWLLCREGEIALFRGHDPASARDLAVRAATLGRDVDDRGLEFTALALEGLALVSAGEVARGMRCLDEATAAATAGEVDEPLTVGMVCCWQIFACERVRDLERAAQWCARLEEFTKRWHFRPLSAVCRTQYAGVLMWRGKWDEAERDLVDAARELEATRPAQTAQALSRLGELRLRQGRYDEAEQLFARAEATLGARVGHALLLLERGLVAEASAEMDRCLAHVPDEPTLRAGALEGAVHARVALGDVARANEALAELQEIARQLGTPPLAASALVAEGELQSAAGERTGAAANFDRAAHLYHECGMPFESARARFALADVLTRIGQHAGAHREATKALEVFEGLGAQRDADRARQWLAARTAGETLGARSTRRRAATPLTPRQLEILSLIAQGLSNPEIAARLEVSDHTVKRHVANLLTRLNLPSRAAAAAYAARHGLL